MGVQGMISINIDKAKAIGNDIRRAKRNEAFKPFDDIIAKQIPGKDAQAAEAERVKIREADALVQEAINAASTTDEIKQAIAAIYTI